MCNSRRFSVISAVAAVLWGCTAQRGLPAVDAAGASGDGGMPSEAVGGNGAAGVGGADGASVDEPAPSCTIGGVRCKNDSLEECRASGWVPTMTCTGFCLTNKCVACKPDAKRCSSDQPEVCDPEGAWSSAGMKCDSGCNSSTGLCNGCPEPGLRTCTGKKTFRCSDDKKWVEDSTCATTQGCVAGACTPCDPNVTSPKCDDNTVSECGLDGQWKLKSTCPKGCVPGTVTCRSCTPETEKRCSSNNTSTQKCNAAGNGWLDDSICSGTTNGQPTCSAGACGPAACNNGFTKCGDGSCRVECPSIQWIQGFPNGVVVQVANGDGSAFVVSYWDYAGKWIKGTGVVGPFDKPSQTANYSDRFFGISDDGRYAAGHEFVTPSDGPVDVTVWDGVEGAILTASEGQGPRRSEGFAMSANGDYIFGNSTFLDGSKAVRWTRTDRSRLVIHPSTAVLTATADGRTAVFAADSLYRWTVSSKEKIYENALPKGITGDGKTVLIAFGENFSQRGLLSASGLADLPLSPAGTTLLFSNYINNSALSQDGHIVVGAADVVIAGERRYDVAIWRSDTGKTAFLKEYLSQRGFAAELQDVRFDGPPGHQTALSRDGRVLFGVANKGVYRIVLP